MVGVETLYAGVEIRNKATASTEDAAQPYFAAASTGAASAHAYETGAVQVCHETPAHVSYVEGKLCKRVVGQGRRGRIVVATAVPVVVFVDPPIAFKTEAVCLILHAFRIGFVFVNTIGWLLRPAYGWFWG